MGMLDRFRRRRRPYAALTDEERMARYVYLLNTLPASVIESAHASAFKDLPPERRRELFEQLRPFMAESERDAASDDPIVLARLMRRAEEHRARRAQGTDQDGADQGNGVLTALSADPRDAVDSRAILLTTGAMALIAHQFVMTSAVALYFTAGAGSLHLSDEPGWVGETFDAGAAGFDGSVGGGFDGGFSGGFDGGMGGFDGGGGFA
ncbi:hypothetical protein [Microbacterium sp. Marseille-Q6648]|uniref:hypothetical protein n=1 Tax=Microbacterium sp. Marseille-Q6648 TaxID=2937991 RepID=UPI00203FC3A8|nr:hypothetical protein [Microbacterium sp. Marseille-Q6648]